MVPEPKPPMRQIAELIDGIATARAEDATALLRIAEMQAIEARLGEKAALETIADRDAQIERVKALLDSALSDCIDRDAEIARLKADLAAALAANPQAATTAVEGPRPATVDEIRAVMRNLDIQPRTGGYVPPPAPPAEDPRIAALCRLVYDLGNRIWPSWCRDPEFPVKSISDDMNTIAGHR